MQYRLAHNTRRSVEPTSSASFDHIEAGQCIVHQTAEKEGRGTEEMQFGALFMQAKVGEANPAQPRNN